MVPFSLVSLELSVSLSPLLSLTLREADEDRIWSIRCLHRVGNRLSRPLAFVPLDASILAYCSFIHQHPRESQSFLLLSHFTGLIVENTVARRTSTLSVTCTTSRGERKVVTKLKLFPLLNQRRMEERRLSKLKNEFKRVCFSLLSLLLLHT